MKVVKLNTYIVATPSPHIGGMYWIFLSIETKCGIVGVGEIYSATFHPEVVVNATKDVFERYLKGQDPHHPCLLQTATQAMYQSVLLGCGRTTLWKARVS